MRYEFSPEWTLRAKEIAKSLRMDYIDLDRIACVKSQGSKSRRTIARIHTIGKVMQLGMQQKPFYTIELITEQFDRPVHTMELKEKTIVHELMHIPEGFKGGFRQHKPFVTQKKVEEMFRELQEARKIQ